VSKTPRRNGVIISSNLESHTKCILHLRSDTASVYLLITSGLPDMRMRYGLKKQNTGLKERIRLNKEATQEVLLAGLRRFAKANTFTKSRSYAEGFTRMLLGTLTVSLTTGDSVR
jgi:hypothetical protein